MATRFYLPSSGAAAAGSPAVHSSWDQSGAEFDRLAAVKTKGTTIMTTKAAGNGGLSAYQSCGFQWVYGPLAAVTISGNISTRCRGRADIYVDLYNARWALYVIQSDFSTVRGTMVAATTAGNTTDWGTSYGNYDHTFTPTSVSAQNGDYLVIEIGADHSASGADDGYDVQIGDTHATDYPYVEFTETILSEVAPTTLSYDYADTARLSLLKDMAGPTHTPTTDGINVTYAVQSGALPTGLSLNATSGLITGTPTARGYFDATIRASNSLGNADATLSWRVGTLGSGSTLSLTMR